MSLSMEDRTGQPRTDEDLQKAIDATKQIMVKQPMILPLFTVHAGIIINCLEELQGLRALIARLRKEKDDSSRFSETMPNCGQSFLTETMLIRSMNLMLCPTLPSTLTPASNGFLCELVHLE